MRRIARRAVVLIAPALGACSLLSGWSDLQGGPEPVTRRGEEAGTPAEASTTAPSEDAAPDPDVTSPDGSTLPGEPTNLKACSSGTFGSCRCTGRCNSTCTDPDCNVAVAPGASETANCTPALGCVVWCEPGASCQTDCAEGHCIIHCAPGSTCATTCNAGTCEIHCPAGATCNNQCNAGTCKFDCATGNCVNECASGNCTGG